MPTTTRERQLAAARARRQAQRQAQRVRRRRQILAVVAGLALVGLAVGLAVTFAGGSSTPKAEVPKGPVTFEGVTVSNPGQLAAKPQVNVTPQGNPTTLQVKDLVVGTGKPASPTSTVNVQYLGVLYANGQEFDSSWSRGQPSQFSLDQVVPGFTQGIGGSATIPPMKEGGRRILIVPPALGYGSQAQDKIPANSVLVFVVDLLNVS